MRDPRDVIAVAVLAARTAKRDHALLVADAVLAALRAEYGVERDPDADGNSVGDRFFIPVPVEATDG